MKRLSILTGLLFLGSSVFAQVENKNGVNVLPETGDYGLGFNAIPMLNFVGNMFNGNGNNQFADDSKFVNFFGGNTLFGKYYLSDKNAVRASLRLNFNDLNVTNSVFDDAGAGPDDEVMDRFSRSFSNINLGLGYEWRRGSTRLQGYYGAEVMIGYSSGTTNKYTYGNGYSASNLSPESTTWNGGGGVISEGGEAERVTEENNASSFSIGARPFAGVEYFVAPKISLGMEFGWSINYTTFGGSETTFESWSSSANEVTTRTVESDGGNNVAIDNDNFGGAIFLMFHF